MVYLRITAGERATMIDCRWWWVVITIFHFRTASRRRRSDQGPARFCSLLWWMARRRKGSRCLCLFLLRLPSPGSSLWPEVSWDWEWWWFGGQPVCSVIGSGCLRYWMIRSACRSNYKSFESFNAGLNNRSPTTTQKMMAIMSRDQNHRNTATGRSEFVSGW